MFNANENMLQHFDSDKHLPIFLSSRLISSLNGTAFRFSRHSDDGVRMCVLEERLEMLKILKTVWNEFLLPATVSADFNDNHRNMMKNAIYIAQQMPLISSTSKFDALITAFAAHIDRVNDNAQNNGLVDGSYIPGLGAPTASVPVWDTSDPRVLWMDESEDDYFFNTLRAQRRSFLNHIVENLEQSPNAQVMLEGFSALLDENVKFYTEVVEDFHSHGFKNVVATNTRYAFGGENFNADQLRALDFVSSIAAGFEMNWPHVENMLEVCVGTNFKVRCDFLDRIINVKTGTIYELMKAKGTFDKAEWLMRSPKQHEWKISEGIIEVFKNAVRTPASTPEEFFQQLTSENVVYVDTQKALSEDMFGFLGRDWVNLKASIQAPTPQKILVAGKPGTGKTSAVASVLAATNRTAITLNAEDEYDLTPETITTIRKSIQSMGNPVFVIDPMDDLLSNMRLPSLFTSISAKKITASEIWVVSDIKRIPAEIIGSFDLVVDVPALPLINRRDLAMKLFDDADLADKVSKSCATPGEITKLHEWSVISGQKDWNSLSYKALNSQQASLKAGTVNSELPVTLYQPSENKRGFESVVGNDHVVKEAQKAILCFRDPQRFKNFNGECAKGLLLTGAPGTGKTHLVRAMAHEAGVPLLVASSAALAGNPTLITSVFAEARRQAPCMLFLDEVDAIGASAENRNGASADPQRQAILNRLLVELNGMDDLENVVVIGATHRPHVLDPALVRPGRLGVSINFSLPERDAREQLWKYYSKDITCEDISWNRVARLSAGMSPADICEAVKVAAMDAAMANQNELKVGNLIKAIDSIGWGDNGPDRKVLENDLWETAVHECGHALLAWVYKMDVDRVSVKPTGSALGYVRHLPNEEKLSYSIKDMEHRVSLSLGGLIAEELVLEGRSMGASSDLEKVRAYVSKMYREEGVGTYVGGVDWDSASDHLKSQVETEEQEKIKEIKTRTTNILRNSLPVLNKLAKKLVKDREISGEELHAFFKAEGLIPESVLALGEPVNGDRPAAVNDVASETQPALAAKTLASP